MFTAAFMFFVYLFLFLIMHLDHMLDVSCAPIAYFTLFLLSNLLNFLSFLMYFVKSYTNSTSIEIERWIMPSDVTFSVYSFGGFLL